MAKQKGIIPLVGTLGGINFYYLNGKAIARKAGGGFNGNAIKTKASMQRVRENGSEFGHCSKVNKVFRTALLPFYKGYTFTYFHSRLMGLFTQLKALDVTSKRGERRVANGVTNAVGLPLLKRYAYTPDCDVRTILPFDYRIAEGSYALTISGFDIKRVGFAEGATHIGLTYGVLNFNFDTLHHDLQLAPPLVLDQSFAGNVVSLVPMNLPEGNGTVLCVLGIRFYQAVDGALYVLNASDSIGLTVLKCA